jgi:sec-independent protein translocase protein TatA
MIGFIIAGMLGPWQIVLIVIALLLLFGGRKIPELMERIRTRHERI